MNHISFLVSTVHVLDDGVIDSLYRNLDNEWQNRKWMDHSPLVLLGRAGSCYEVMEDVAYVVVVVDVDIVAEVRGELLVAIDHHSYLHQHILFEYYYSSFAVAVNGMPAVVETCVAVVDGIDYYYSAVLVDWVNPRHCTEICLLLQ